jgi:DNA-binding XRE family transcriptional regulator
MEIMSKIDELLEVKGMSAEELAGSTGLPRMTIYNARRGKNVTLITAMKIAKSLDVEVSEIWQGFVDEDGPEIVR